jgi:hypothetical protein
MIRRLTADDYYPRWAIIFGAALLALLLMWHEPYWYDEAFTALLSRLPMADLLRATAADVHPPLHYLIVSLFVRIQPGELGTRGWSVFCQICALATLMRLLTLLKIETRLHIPILLLVAFLPVELLYSTEGRMYAQLQLLVLLQVMAVLERRWWLLGVATTLALYTHNYAVFYSLIIGMVALLTELRSTCYHPLPPKYIHLGFVGFAPQQSRFRWIFLALGIPILLWLPWVIYGVIPQAMLAASGHHWIQPITIGQSLYALFMVTQTTAFPKILCLVLAVIVAFGLIVTFRTAWRAKQILLLALAYGPWLLASLASLITPLLLYRGLLPSIPFIAILVVYAIQQARGWGRAAGIALLVLSVGISLMTVITDAAGVTREDSLDVHTQVDPGLMVHLDDSSLVTFGAYPQPGVSQAMLTSECPENLGSLRPVVRQAMHFPEIQVADLPDHYTLVAWIGPLSTACHQDLYKQLIIGSQVIARSDTAFGTGGIYAISH